MNIQDAFIARAVTLGSGLELLRRGKFKAAFRMFRLCWMYTRLIRIGLKQIKLSYKVNKYVPKVDDAAFEVVADDLADQITKEINNK